MNAVAGSTITVAVAIKDNSLTVLDPTASAQPINPSQVTVNLFTPSRQQPVINLPLSPQPSFGIGVFTYAYNSSITDETGLWYHSFFAANGSTVAYSPIMPAFTLLPNQGPQGPNTPSIPPSPTPPGFRGFATGPPTVGTYQLGDWFRNSSPVPSTPTTPGSPSGWTCVQGGTPGIWAPDPPIGIVGSA